MEVVHYGATDVTQYEPEYGFEHPLGCRLHRDSLAESVDVQTPLPGISARSGGRPGDAKQIDFISAPDNPIWDFGANNFTIELWVNLGTPGAGLAHRRGDQDSPLPDVCLVAPLG